MKLPSILEKINPYIDTNLSVQDMWKLATVGYDADMVASEQIPPMELLVEKTVGGSSVLGVRNEDDLKQYVQDVFNKAEESGTDSGNDADGTENNSDSSGSSGRTGANAGSSSRNLEAASP
jgi:anionic cell wall polymer biosynthesis LytR-Cps2A-Psr (LCP) family protein